MIGCATLSADSVSAVFSSLAFLVCHLSVWRSGLSFWLAYHLLTCDSPENPPANKNLHHINPHNSILCQIVLSLQWYTCYGQSWRVWRSCCLMFCLTKFMLVPLVFGKRSQFVCLHLCFTGSPLPASLLTIFLQDLTIVHYFEIVSKSTVFPFTTRSMSHSWVLLNTHCNKVYLAMPVALV